MLSLPELEVVGGREGERLSSVALLDALSRLALFATCVFLHWSRALAFAFFLRLLLSCLFLSAMSNCSRYFSPADLQQASLLPFRCDHGKHHWQWHQPPSKTAVHGPHPQQAAGRGNGRASVSSPAAVQSSTSTEWSTMSIRAEGMRKILPALPPPPDSGMQRHDCGTKAEAENRGAWPTAVPVPVGEHSNGRGGGPRASWQQMRRPRRLCLGRPATTATATAVAAAATLLPVGGRC